MLEQVVLEGGREHTEMILAKCGEQILGGPEDRGRIALRWYRIRLDPDPDALWSEEIVEEDLSVGSRVKLRGLVKKTTLNGRVGTVADLDYRKSGNLAIRLDACSWDRSRLLQIRRVNILLASSITQEENEEVEISFDGVDREDSNLGKIKETYELLDNVKGGFYQPSVDDVGTRICLRVQGLGENSSLTKIAATSVLCLDSEVKRVCEENMKELYERNKDVFFSEFKKIQYAEITPAKITGSKEYSESFFKQLDIIENNVLDGQSFAETVQNDNLEIILIEKINSKKEDENKTKIKNLPDDLFKKIYNLSSIKSPEIINFNNKFYIAEISNIEKKNRPFNDPQVQEALIAQLNFKNKIEKNNSILKDLSMGAFNKERYEKFALDNKLDIKDYKIKDLKQNEIFSEGIIKRIFLAKDGEIKLITNNTLTKNFLIIAIKSDYKKIEKGSNEYEQYEAKARLNLINKIYQSHDSNLNEKYKVELNQRTIDRVKNSF